MAKEAAFAMLRRLGCDVSDTMIHFSSRFIVEDLCHSFGLFTFDGKQASYRMLPLSECDKHAKDDPAFVRDVQFAKEGVREGKGIAIVIACIVQNDAFTQLVYMPVG
jgi:hypothetical protein